jgi:type IV secretion system protein VirB10
MPSPNEYRALAEESTRSVVAARGGAASTFIRYGIPAGAVLFAAWMIYAGTRTPERSSITNPDTEDFRTTQYPAPSIETPRPQLNPGTIEVPKAPEPPPPPPAQPPTTIEAPPPPPPLQPPRQTAAPDDDEARRLAEEERRRWERLRAGQVVQDSGSLRGEGGDPRTTGSFDAENREEDPNRRFLARAGQAGVEMSEATKNNRIDALVAQGTMIKGVLETAIQSDLAGMVRAVVSENVWSFDGRRILIPAGSRLVGEYRSGLTTGQTRVFIVWTRLLRSDGVSVQLGSIGTDELGRTGMTGIVDRHYVEKFGSAILLSLVGGASQYIANLGSLTPYGQGQAAYIDPLTGQPVLSQAQPNQNTLYAQQIGAQQVSMTMNRIAEEALRDSIRIPPTIHVDQGSRIMVFVRRDLDFSAFYPDPIKEALAEIRRERASGRRIHSTVDRVVKP